MNSKKPLITIIIIIVVLAVGWYLWRGGYFGKIFGTTTKGTTTTTTTQPGMGGGQVSEPATGAKTGTVGKMTDDIYVELIVQTAYQAQKNPATYAANMKALFAKYGITEENVTAYGEALSKDPARAQAVALKYSQELQKLLK